MHEHSSGFHQINYLLTRVSKSAIYFEEPFKSTSTRTVTRTRRLCRHGYMNKKVNDVMIEAKVTIPVLVPVPYITITRNFSNTAISLCISFNHFRIFTAHCIKWKVFVGSQVERKYRKTNFLRHHCS